MKIDTKRTGLVEESINQAERAKVKDLNGRNELAINHFIEGFSMSPFGAGFVSRYWGTIFIYDLVDLGSAILNYRKMKADHDKLTKKKKESRGSYIPSPNQVRPPKPPPKGEGT